MGRNGHSFLLLHPSSSPPSPLLPSSSSSPPPLLLPSSPHPPLLISSPPPLLLPSSLHPPLLLILPSSPLSLLFSLFLGLESDFTSHSLTVLSKPSVINIKKKMMAKNVDAGMLAMASAYVMKRRLGPETEGEREGAQSLFKELVLGAKGAAPSPHGLNTWKGLSSPRQ